MVEVLGRVTGQLSENRGPDVEHRIEVPTAWLQAGDTIELELPRNLTCACCHGGGCDACGRSGAASTRSRGELPELIELTLPRRPADAGRASIVLRIPERGGVPLDDHTPQRGLLLLEIHGAESPGEGVSRVGRRSLVHSLPSPRAIPSRYLLPAGVLLLVVLAWLFWAIVAAP